MKVPGKMVRNQNHPDSESEFVRQRLARIYFECFPGSFPCVNIKLFFYETSSLVGARLPYGLRCPLAWSEA